MVKNCKKIIALAIIVSFVFCQGAFAANPRELLSRAKASFDSPDTRRGGFVTAQALQSSQNQQESLINQKQALVDLQKINSNPQPDGSYQESFLTGQVTPLPSLPPPAPVIPSPGVPLPEDTVFVDSTNDTHFGLQWGLDAINAEEAWAFNRGEGIVAAIIDTGLDFLHPDIQSSIWLNAEEIAGNGIDDDFNGLIDDTRGWDFYFGDNNPTDDNGHGTHVAGIVAATQNNSLGISGVAPGVKIMPLKVLDSLGGGILSTILSAINSAIRYAANEGAKIINMSLGLATGYFNATTLAAFQSAIQYARNLGSIVVASAGNDYGSIQKYPALFNEVITVGALKFSSGQYVRDSYSNSGSQLDFMAPGTNVLSLRAKNTNTSFAYPSPNGDYVYFSGTSMAAPHVVGAVSLLLAQDPFMSFDDIYRRLQFSSTDLGIAGYDTSNGYGMVDAFKALSYDYYDNGVVKTHWLTAPDLEGVVRFDYNSSGKLTKKTLFDGNTILYDYHPGSANLKSAYYSASGELRTYFDEDFFGNSTGRLLKKTKSNGSYNEYRYWYDSAQVRFDSSYDSTGNLVDLVAYDEDGNIIAGSDPVLNQTLNAQNYTSASGTVYKYSPDILVMYGNRSVNYALNIGENGNYSLKFSTAQVTSKNAPPGYLFHFNFKIDGVTVASADLNSSKTFTLSDFIDLGALTQGAHTLTLQWTNDYNTSPYDANVGFKGIEVYELVGDVSVPPLLPCDGVSCIYDPSGRLDTVYFSDGTQTQYEYIAGTTQPSQISEINQLGNPVRNIFPSQNQVESFYYYPSNRVQKIVWTTYTTNAFLNQYDYYDEPGYSLNRGRLAKFTNQNGSYTTYANYFGASTIARFQRDYDTNGALLVTREYDSAGNLISTTYPPPPADPILVSTINAQSYTSASGTVYKSGTDTLIMYGNRSVNYALNIGENGEYSLKFQTAQVSSKNAPPGYLFNFNIKIDGVTLANVNLNSSRTFTLSDFIDLRNLTAGAHTLALQWTNDYNTSPYDANVGFKNIKLYRMPSDQIAPTGSVSINNGATHTNSADITLNLDATDAVSSQDNLQMAFSQDGVNFTPFEPFATEKALTLEGGDGEKTITTRFRDEAGNTAQFSDTIVLDRIAPSATLTSPTLTNRPLYTLAYTVMDNVDGERTLSEQITLLQGPNSISRTVTDSAGNSRMLTWTVTLLPVDSTLPVAYQATFVPLEWVETTALTGITFDDEGRSFALPFTFRFFGEVFTQIQVSSNGFVQFGSCNSCYDFTPDTIPNPSSPNGIAAPLWRDLNPGRGGRITYLASPTQFVVSWEDVPTFSSPYSPQRFQLILQSDGSLTFQYVTVTSGPTTAVGLENSAGTQGMAYTLLPRNGIAVKFSDINQ